jgi:hypothetical protein
VLAASTQAAQRGVRAIPKLPPPAENCNNTTLKTYSRKNCPPVSNLIDHLSFSYPPVVWRAHPSRPGRGSPDAPDGPDALFLRGASKFSSPSYSKCVRCVSASVTLPTIFRRYHRVCPFSILGFQALRRRVFVRLCQFWVYRYAKPHVQFGRW